jgi:hypothetical protein
MQTEELPFRFNGPKHFANFLILKASEPGEAPTGSFLKMGRKEILTDRYGAVFLNMWFVAIYRIIPSIAYFT